MRVNLNSFTIDTLGRLGGVKAFVQAIDIAIPEAQLHVEESLRLLAQEHEWQPEEYQLERLMLDEQYRHWVPRLATYSAVVLLHSAVETLLFACADHVRASVESAIRKKTPRRGLDRARRSLQKVATIDVAIDKAWPDLLRLEELRNIIVHRGGNLATSDRDRKAVDRLAGIYPSRVWVAVRSGLHDPCLCVSAAFCSESAKRVEGFGHQLLSKIAAQ